MADFREIIGHQNIIDHFRKAIELHKVGHAYILNGPDRSGKRMLAEAFAETLQCEKGGADPCHECRFCKQTESRNNPDIIYVQHEKPNTVSVDDIRTQVVNDVDIRPYACAYKIYIIDEAEKMNEQAQNALLKTIEEPPSYAVILLLTNNADRFLPTILSRCVRLNLTPVKDEEIRSYLVSHCGIDEDEARFAAAFAQGNVGKAVSLASSENFKEIRYAVITLLKRIDRMDLQEVVSAVKKINEYKLDIDDYFDIALVWFRDLLLFKATMEIDNLTFKDEIVEIKRQSDQHSYQGIDAIIEGIEKAKVRLAANVNFDLTMELLLMTIKEG